jgi:hypothetical protein
MSEIFYNPWTHKFIGDEVNLNPIHQPTAGNIAVLHTQYLHLLNIVQIYGQSVTNIETEIPSIKADLESPHQNLFLIT